VLALMNLVWALACLLVLGGSLWATAAGAAVAFAAAAGVFALGECLHGTALTPLVADLAPPDVLGRAMALVGTSWWLGLTLTPAVGGFSLGVSTAGTWCVALGLSLMLALLMLALETIVPAAARLTPRAAEAT
jgi:hypothetical protein